MMRVWLVVPEQEYSFHEIEVDPEEPLTGLQYCPAHRRWYGLGQEIHLTREEALCWAVVASRAQLERLTQRHRELNEEALDLMREQEGAL